jgi:transposase
MKAIVLTVDQRKQVERRRKQTLDRRIYQRLTAVLTVAAGYTPEDIAQLLGVELALLNQWLRVFRNDGLEALCTLAADEPNPSDH